MLLLLLLEFIDDGQQPIIVFTPPHVKENNVTVALGALLQRGG
ncbi:hypothetical protein [Streptomyces sp. NPDC056194]